MTTRGHCWACYCGAHVHQRELSAFSSQALMWIQAVWVTRCNNCWRNYKKSLVKDAAARLSLLEMCVFIWALTVSAWGALLRGRLCVCLCVCAPAETEWICHCLYSTYFSSHGFTDRKWKKKKIQRKLFVLSDFWECRHASVGCTFGKEVYLFMHVCVYLCARTRTGNRDISGLFGAQR